VATPAVIYAAKSTTDLKASIPNQIKEGRALAADEDRDVVATFKDEKKSGYSQDRGPGLIAAREEAERLVAEHGECALIIQHSDRLARGDGRQAAHLVEYALWAMKSGVIIRSIQDPETFAQDDLIYPVLTGHRNHEDSKRKSAACKAGLRERRAEGKWGGGPRPYGYTYDRVSEMLLPLEVEVAVVRRIFEEYMAGASLTAIAKSLEADHVSPRRGRHWRSSTISQVLSNPVYIGKMRHFDEVHDGTHEAVIKEKTWQQVQVMLDSRRKGGKGRPPKNRQHLLHGGLLRCECGGTMICRTDRHAQKYVCERRHGRIGNCTAPTLPREVVDSAIYAYFEQVGLDVDATRAQVAGARDRKLKEVQALAEQSLGERRRAEERLDRVRRDYADGKLSAEDWAGFRDELEGELSAAVAEVERLDRQHGEVKDWQGIRDAERDALYMLADIRDAIARGSEDSSARDAVRAALLRLFDRFELRRAAPGTRVHADLAWINDLVIDPVPRESAIEGYTALRPIFRREPLYDSAENQRLAQESRHFSDVFGPIPVLTTCEPPTKQ
jgi:DNA invertase Pin-like site-specific DNA recombinase